VAVCLEDDSRNGQATPAQNMEGVATVSKLVDKEHHLTLKFMKDQLHIN